ncbi:MAG: RNA-binding S4 domain-containing protein [Thermoanaerobacteraceae bacterium]|nr:RNA-binding S4 domain-containing protein [Thermoanaerobacteraceae bacterium]
MKEIIINTDFIRLDQLLKWADIVSTGGEAKNLINRGIVKVNNEKNTSRSKKIYPGDIISINDTVELKVVSQS